MNKQSHIIMLSKAKPLIMFILLFQLLKAAEITEVEFG